MAAQYVGNGSTYSFLVKTRPILSLVQKLHKIFDQKILLPRARFRVDQIYTILNEIVSGSCDNDAELKAVENDANSGNGAPIGQL